MPALPNGRNSGVFLVGFGQVEVLGVGELPVTFSFSPFQEEYDVLPYRSLYNY